MVPKENYMREVIKADKGKQGGSCNRTACQAPGAHYYNPHTWAYYCVRCARMLNDVFARDGLKLIDMNPEVNDNA